MGDAKLTLASRETRLQRANMCLKKWKIEIKISYMPRGAESQ
jgi:hypothetical protein